MENTLEDQTDNIVETASAEQDTTENQAITFEDDNTEEVNEEESDETEESLDASDEEIEPIEDEAGTEEITEED